MKRIDSWELREQLREHALAPARARHCGRTRYSREVTLCTSGEGAWYEGVMQCRARVCPPCFIARRFKLAHEIEHVVRERERETRAQSVLATLTVRHHAEDPVTLAKQVRVAWRDFLQSRWWRVFRNHHECEFIVAEEVTHGANGWHPHLHVLLMPRVPIDVDGELAAEAEQLARDARRLEPERSEASMRARLDALERGAAPNLDVLRAHIESPHARSLSGPPVHEWHDVWSRSVARKIGAAHLPSRERGAHLEPCDSARYLTKLGLELADPSVVKGRSPLALLDAGERDLYMELQASRVRARDITWSRGLRGIRESMPEHEPPAELATLSGSEWGLLLHYGWQRPLEVAEQAKDPETARAALDKALRRKSP